MQTEERSDLFQIIRKMVGGSGRLDVLEAFYRVDWGEGRTELEEMITQLRQMGKKPRRKVVTRHLRKLIADGWVQSRLITLDWCQYRLVKEKRCLLVALDEEANKQQLAQAALAAEATASALAEAMYWSEGGL